MTPVTLATLAALPTAPPVALKDLTVPQLGEAFRGLDAAQANYSKLSGICATMKGLVLCEVKAKLKHGKFLPWLKEHFPKTRKTAAQYMRLAAEFGQSNPKVTFAILSQDLLTTLEAAKDLQLDLANPLVASVAAWVGERTAYQLLLELDAGGDARRHNPGGYRPNLVLLRSWLTLTYPDGFGAPGTPGAIPPAELWDTAHDELPKEIRARYKAEGERYRQRLKAEEIAEIERHEAALAWWQVTAPALLAEPLAGQYWLDAPEVAGLKTLDEELGALRARVREEIERRNEAKRGTRQ